MKFWLSVGLLLAVPTLFSFAPDALPPQPGRPLAQPSTLSAAEMQARFAKAEAAYAEGSYALAVERYQAVSSDSLTPEEQRWIGFRLADAGWRADSATGNPDPTVMSSHWNVLQSLRNDEARSREPGYLQAEVAESMGDYFWVRANQRNWGQAQPHYLAALDTWGQSTDLDTARERYLNIVWKIADAEPNNWRWQASTLPTAVLEATGRIVQSPGDKAKVDYLLALNLRYGNERGRLKASNYFESAIDAGKSHPFHDDALFEYGQHLASSGRMARTEYGGVQWKADYPKALIQYRRLVSEYSKGETPYYDRAENEIRNITQPSVGLALGHAFLPGSRIEFHAHWRNVAGVDLAVYPVDLTSYDEGRLDGKNKHDWLQELSLSGLRPTRSWREERASSEDHEPRQEKISLDPGLEPGAYVVTAGAGDQKARELILVTRISLLLKSDQERLLLWATDALTGEPISNADIKIVAKRNDHRDASAKGFVLRTDGDGLARLDWPGARDNRSMAIYAFARSDEQQTFAQSHVYRTVDHDRGNWRVYAYADRPAYRPGETVEWKITARISKDARYSTPAGELLSYRIRDPRGNEVAKGDLTLNEFGGAWAKLELDASWPLGEYNIQFDRAKGSDTIGNATLFRMEEYKLPEFLVRVELPDEDGKPKLFRVGDMVEADVIAEYTFGGPVAGADVEVVVHQKAFHPWWRPPGRFPWMQDQQPAQSRFHPGWRGNEVFRQSLTTDADGKARIVFESPFDTSQDYEYSFEARVTDASRREIVGSASVRVARQSYFVFLHPQSPLIRPRESSEVRVRTEDANGRSVAATGTVTVNRQIWQEIWIGPGGRELRGSALRKARRSDASYPAGIPGWRPVTQGYRQEFVQELTVSTGDDGEAKIPFRPDESGYYRIDWRSEDVDGLPILASTQLWVTDGDVEYLEAGGADLRIVADPDSFREGRDAPVLISVPGANRWVLMTTVLDGIDEVRVLHVTGDAKLVELPIGPRHAPNFAIDASMILDARHMAERMNVQVAPESNLLETSVSFDKERYLPGEKGTVTVTAQDNDGKPADAEVALSLVDSSVFYIQQPYAADPRAFFFGQQRGLAVTTACSLDSKRLLRLDGKDDADAQDPRSPSPAPAAKMVAFGRAQGGAIQALESSSFSDEFEGDLAAGVRNFAASKKEQDAGGAGGGGDEVVVRTDFRSTLLWEPSLRTGSDGTATAEFTMADTLSSWEIVARGIDRETRVGQAKAETRSNKPLIVRLQMPRFLVSGDQVVLSAIVNNNTDEAVSVSPTLKAGSLTDVERIGGNRSLTVPAGGEIRADWRARAESIGPAEITVSVQAGEHSDAMRRELPVFEHGIDQLLARSGKLSGSEGRIVLDLPDARRPGSTELLLKLSPSLGGTVLDALPYLIDYPYGCTEQTMSRFLPAAIVADTLKRLDLDASAVFGRNFGGIESAHVDKTHPKGPKDLDELDKMVRKGFKRLADFQHGDGGWGWWKEGNSDPFMTAYVVWGLSLAEESGRRIPDGMLERGAEYLSRELVQAQGDPDRQAWLLHAVATARASGAGSATKFEAQASDNLWNRRDRLSAYGKSLFALALHARKEQDRAETLIRNLRNGVQRDKAPDLSAVQRGFQQRSSALGTAHWGSDGFWWRWNDSPVETTSFALRAMIAVEPDNDLIEPTVNWLVRNRRGAQWSNTRDTAIATLALTGYLEQSGELSRKLDVEISVNGGPARVVRASAEEILGATMRLELDGETLRGGRNEIRLTNRSGGPLYYAAEARFFNMEEPVRPAGSELFVRRQYHRKVPQPTLLGGIKYATTPLNDGEQLQSGDRVEVVLTVETKNDFEYLLFEDLKPAGLEAVDLVSGGGIYARELTKPEVEHRLGTPDRSSRRARPSASTEAVMPRRSGEVYVSPPVTPTVTGRTQWLYRELRDRKVALFADKLPQGVWEIRYELRAEVPGKFHALPVLAEAMYVPEIRGNGAEIRLEVLD